MVATSSKAAATIPQAHERGACASSTRSYVAARAAAETTVVSEARLRLVKASATATSDQSPVTAPCPQSHAAGLPLEGEVPDQQGACGESSGAECCDPGRVVLDEQLR